MSAAHNGSVHGLHRRETAVDESVGCPETLLPVGITIAVGEEVSHVVKTGGLLNQRISEMI